MPRTTIAPYFFVENKKECTFVWQLSLYQEKLNKLHFFLWEVLKNFWIFYLIYGYEKTKNGLFLGQQQNSNYDVISTINQSSCHLTICLADWVAISLTSGRLSIKRENESVADHMKKMTFVGKKHFNYHLPSIS